MSKDQKEIKVKKVDKNGKPLEGVEFKLYLDSTMDSNDTEYSTSLTDKNGIATFEVEDFYYGGYIKETKTLKSYILRDDEKDTIPFYKDNGVRFLGEIASDDMKVTSINQYGKEKELNTNKNINQELQGLVSDESRSFNNNTNWLVYNDNGVEKLVAKKPIKYSISWNQLYNAGVVFGKDGVKDLINADFTHEFYSGTYYPPGLEKDSGKGKGTPKTYKPTYVTLNDKKYIVRLMRAYNENAKINDNKSWGNWESSTTQSYVKGSEWNRLLLPLIDPTGDNNRTGYNNGTNGRYGLNTKKFVEINMPTLANYSWRTDFGGNSNHLGNYNKGDEFGYWRWAQETGYGGNQYRAVRGDNSSSDAASYSNDYDSFHDWNFRGWQPVLEKVDN